MPQDDLKVRNINVQHVTAPNSRGVLAQIKRVTYFVGDHGPFTKDYEPPAGTAADIKADIQAQVAELQSIQELQG